ncbi:MAG TPA: PDZ domain-containing protein [Anaerolineales bacterium]|nr:PDZ domain-containing protein [Anaerolineales bacterium]
MPSRSLSLQAKSSSQYIMERRLRGKWLYVARGGYVIISLIVLVLSVLGVPEYIRYLDEGKIGAEIAQNNRGEIILLPILGLDANQAGVVKGDVLVAINDTVIPLDISIEEVLKLFKGKKGETVTITVRTDNQAPRSYTIIRSRLYLEAAEYFHIPFSVLKVALIVLGIVSIFGFGVIGLLIFIKRSDDWMAFLIALALITYAAISDILYFGAQRIGLTALYYSLDSIGSLLPALLLFLFPNGHFVPARTRLLSRFLFLWAIASFFLLTLSPSWWPEHLTFWIWMVFFVIGVSAQGYRFLYVAKPVERQQIKWIVIGFPFAVLANMAYYLIPGLSLGTLKTAEKLFLADVLFAMSRVANLLVALGLGLAVARYKLWDTDFYINRAWVYSIVTGLLAIVWWLSVELLQVFLNRFTNLESQSSPVVAALLSSIQVAALFRPARDWVEKWINVHFYKDRVDFTKVIVELQPENWQFISVRDLYRALTANTASLLESNASAVYAYRDGSIHLISVKGITSARARRPKINQTNISALQQGKVVQLNEDKLFKLLIPLVVPRGRVHDLVGILALGPRVENRGYSRDHLNDLKDLGQYAGTAIYFLQLNEKRLASIAK